MWLCGDCHRGTKGVHGRDGHEKDVSLQQAAEWAWLNENGYIHVTDHPTLDPEGIEEWIRIIGKNYL